MKFLETKTMKGIIYINIDSITTLEVENQDYTRIGLIDGTHIYVGENIEKILERL
jgi:acetolactate synthase small subunit